MLCFLFAATMAWVDEDEDYEELAQVFQLGEPVYTQEGGEIQLSITALRADYEEERESAFAFIFEYGLSDRLEVGVSAPYSRISGDGQDQSGWDDVELELGYGALTDFAGSGALTFRFGVAAPTADGDAGEDDDWGWEAGAIYGKAWGLGQCHLGFNYESEDDEDETSLFALAAFPLGERWRFTLEALAVSEDDEDGGAAGPGLVWARGDWEISGGATVGWGDEAYDWGVALAVTCEF